MVRSEKVRRQQRRVIVAQILTQPAQPPRQVPAHQAKRHDQSDVALGKAADGDHRAGAAAFSDMLLPSREPVESLEGGTVGSALELPPFGFDRAELAENLNGEVRREGARSFARTRDCDGANVNRRGQVLNGHVVQCRQCRGARHSTH